MEAGVPTSIAEAFPALSDILVGNLLRPVFQPIIAVDRRQIYCHEGLIRGPLRHPLEFPDRLFDSAQGQGMLYELETAAASAIIRTFDMLGMDGCLSVNLNPDHLTQMHWGEEFRRLIDETGMRPDRFILELTEHHPVHAVPDLLKAVRPLRAAGIRIALDDVGAGFANMRLLCELRPDLIKIDVYFVRDVHCDPVKRKFIRNLMEMARAIGALVVAEGVEEPDELQVLSEMGIDLVQGFLFGRPTDNPGATQLHWPDLPKETSHTPIAGADFGRAADLLQAVPAYPARLTVRELLGSLRAGARHGEAIPVCDGTFPVGLIRRQDLLEKMASSATRRIFARREIRHMVDPATIVVDEYEPLDRISAAITQRETFPGASPPEHWIITHRGEYAGVGCVNDLLARITTAQVALIRHAHPLSGLPGNVPIQKRLGELLDRRIPFTAAQCDLANFQPFNNRFGFPAGDILLRGTADILSRVTGFDRARLQPDFWEHFVGHANGDHFFVILHGLVDDGFWTPILAEFDRLARSHYPVDDIAQGGAWQTDRRGRSKFQPLVKLSIGAVHCPAGRFRHPLEVTEAAWEVQSQAKRAVGSQVFIDRRG